MSSPPDDMQLDWLMTDGTVLAQSGSNWSNFYLLTPDSTGNYANGTWTQVGSLQSGYGPDAAAADVLANGLLVITGGEYNSPGNGYDLQLTNLGAVYDPTRRRSRRSDIRKSGAISAIRPRRFSRTDACSLGDKLTKWMHTSIRRRSRGRS